MKSTYKNLGSVRKKKVVELNFAVNQNEKFRGKSKFVNGQKFASKDFADDPKTLREIQFPRNRDTLKKLNYTKYS